MKQPKKKSRVQHSNRQRQKMSRRTVVILAASCLTLMTIGITIVFNFSNGDRSMADNQHGSVSVVNIPQQVLILEKTIAQQQPLIINQPVGPHVLVMRGKKVDRLPNQPLPTE